MAHNKEWTLSHATVNISKAGETSVEFSKTLTHATANKYVTEDLVDTLKVSVPVEVKEGVFSNAPATSTAYIENEESNTILPAEGALYINEGWYPNTKITLGHMIPDDANLPNAGDNHILSGYEAYDADGKKLIGTMSAIPTSTVQKSVGGGGVSAAISASHSATEKVTVDEKLPSDAASYGITTTSPTTASSAIAISASTAVTNGTVSIDATPSRGAVTFASAVIGNVGIPANTVALASATGTVASKSITCTPSVVDNFGVYINKTSIPNPGVSVSAAAASATITDSGSILKTTAPSSYYTLTTALSTANGSAKGTLASYAAGATTSSASKSGTASAVSVAPTTSTYYVAKTSVPAPGVSVSAASVTATISATGATLLTASTAGKQYVTFQTKQSATSGSAKGSLASVAAGYTASKAAANSTASAVSVSQTNNTYYLPVVANSHTITTSNLITYAWDERDSSKTYGYVRCEMGERAAGYIASAASTTNTKYIEIYDGSCTLS